MARLIMATSDRLIPIQQVCQHCLMASQAGEPRWENGQLRCGHAIVIEAMESSQQPDQFECEMGFRVIKIS